MASFLSPNYVPEFNPAISTIPIDLYGKVIMQKQAEYNQGVQRTQAYIQNVTGLEMGREQDQQYYNQKVGEYKQKISGLLTSDFSSQDVVMQTASVSSQLYNDKRIRNSVMSRLYEKDIYQQLQKAQEDGTYAPENAAPALQAVQNWKMGDENATLGKMTYTPFDNYTPRLQAYMKSIHPDVRIDQNSPIGADGRALPYVLQEGKVVAIDDAKVMAAYNSFFQTDASARNQKGLTTSYYSRNISDEQARDALKSMNDQALKSIDDNIKYRQRLLVSRSQDPNRVQQLNNEIAQLQENRTQREQNYQQDLADFVANPLQVKANLYDREQRRQIADVFGYKEQSSKIVKDPSWEAAYQVQQDIQKQSNENRDYDLRVRGENRLQAEADRKALEEERKAATGSASGLPPLQPENLATLDPSFATPENVDKRINTAAQDAGRDIWKFVYDATTTEQNGQMVSANGNLIQKNGDVYSLRPGATTKQVSDALFAMKKEWDAGRVKANPRIMDIYSDYFDSSDESRGYAKLMKANRDKQDWDSLKGQAGYDPSVAQTGRDPNYVNLGVGGERPLTANSNIIGRLFGTESRPPEGQVVSENFKKWTGNSNVKNYAKLYAEAQSLPSIPVTKAKPDEDGYDVNTNAITRIAETQFGNSGDIEKYKKAISKATGFNVYYDKGNNQWYAGINTLEEGVPPLSINYQQAVYLGGSERVNAVLNTTNRFSAWEGEQQRSGGTMQPKNLRLSTDAYDIRWKSEVRNGVQYPTIEYRPAGNEGAQYMPLPKTYTNGIYSFDQLNERLNYIKNASQAQLEAILNLK